ncbi:Holliday junction resolvase RuvX [Anaplasma bovis]|uniref:Holliday junction resolvase RuvX n=1 Tax=Anaplasma bovis TaxID=186733 RepID=UPI002FEE6ED6
MLINDVGYFFSLLSSSRVMCIDFGEKTMGIALNEGSVAMPLCVYDRRNTRQDLGELCAIFREKKAGGIVMGLPLESDGREGRMCELVRVFAAKLVKKIGANVYLHDERYTTAAASKMTESVGMRRKKSQKIDDMISAALILQQVLDIAKTKGVQLSIN